MRVYVTDRRASSSSIRPRPRRRQGLLAAGTTWPARCAGKYGARATPHRPRGSPTVHPLRGRAGQRGRRARGVLTVGKPTDSVDLFLDRRPAEDHHRGGRRGRDRDPARLALSRGSRGPIERLTRVRQAIREAGGRRCRRLAGARSASGEGVRGDARRAGGQAVRGELRPDADPRNEEPALAIRGAAELLEEDMPAEQRARFLEPTSAPKRPACQALVDRLLRAGGAREPQGPARRRGRWTWRCSQARSVESLAADNSSASVGRRDHRRAAGRRGPAASAFSCGKRSPI